MPAQPLAESACYLHSQSRIPDDPQRQATGAAPYPLAMVVCDGFWRDPYTGKHTLIGTFSAIGGTSFPVVHPIVTVYVALTDGRGKTLLKLQLVDLDEEHDALVELKQEVDF